MDTFVLGVELRATKEDITYARMTLWADRLIIEDSSVVVAWLQDYPSPGAVIHPLVYDIKSLLSGCISSNIRHIYSEMNSAANWIASFIAHHFGQGCFNDYFLLSMFFRDILCSNFLGCIHTRII